MTIQSYLEGYIFYEKLIRELEKRKQEALHDAIRITSYPKEISVKYTMGNNAEDKNIRYIDKIEKLNARISEIQKEMYDIENAVRTVQTVKYRMLLELKYLEGESWENVAEALGMSDKWVREELNSRALRELKRTGSEFLPTGI